MYKDKKKLSNVTTQGISQQRIRIGNNLATQQGAKVGIESGMQ